MRNSDSRSKWVDAYREKNNAQECADTVFKAEKSNAAIKIKRYLWNYPFYTAATDIEKFQHASC